MQDGAIVHLTEDGARKLEVPDDHMVMCMHALSFEREGHVFFQREISDYQGQDFTLKLTRTSSIVC